MSGTSKSYQLRDDIDPRLSNALAEHGFANRHTLTVAEIKTLAVALEMDPVRLASYLLAAEQ